MKPRMDKSYSHISSIFSERNLKQRTKVHTKNQEPVHKDRRKSKLQLKQTMKIELRIYVLL